MSRFRVILKKGELLDYFQITSHNFFEFCKWLEVETDCTFSNELDDNHWYILERYDKCKFKEKIDADRDTLSEYKIKCFIPKEYIESLKKEMKETIDKWMDLEAEKNDLSWEINFFEKLAKEGK